MSCSNGCQTDIGGNIAVEFLPNMTIQWNGVQDTEYTILKNNIELVLSVGNIKATFTGPPQNTQGDGYLPLTNPEITQGISICKPICCTDCNGSVTKTYECCSTNSCATFRTCINHDSPCNPCNTPCNPCNTPCDPCNTPCDPCNTPCDPCNSNPCNSDPCNSDPCNNNPCNTPQYTRPCNDPIKAYLEANPYNVMYPTALVPYNQTVNNPFRYPTPYYKRYDACLPCIPHPTELLVDVKFPNFFTGTVTTTNYGLQGGLVPNAFGTGSTTVTLPRESSSNSSQITFYVGAWRIILNEIQLNYSFSSINGLPTWTIYGGNLNLRNGKLGS